MVDRGCGCTAVPSSQQIVNELRFGASAADLRPIGDDAIPLILR